MAMKKAELEEHRDNYDDLLSEALAARKDGEYRLAVQRSLKAWEFVDGMMQYERRYNSREFGSVTAIDLILKYAPLLLDCESLDKLADLLHSCRRIEKNTSESLAEKLDHARARLWDAHCLYDHLERNPGARQDELRRTLGGEQDGWRQMAEAWEKMGLVFRKSSGGSYALNLVTRLGELVPAMCSACGVLTEAPKAMLLEELSCPDCGETNLFLILADIPAAKEEA